MEVDWMLTITQVEKSEWILAIDLEKRIDRAFGGCWSRKFWELSTISEAKWTKGINVCQKRRNTSTTKGKGSSVLGKKEYQCKERLY
jgi:hypothetical protein